MTLEPIIPIPRLYSGIAEWLACVLYISMLPKRFNRSTTLMLLGLMCILQCYLQVVVGSWPVILFLLGMILAVGMMFFTVFLCTKTTLHQAGYVTARAFALAEFAAAVEWQLYNFNNHSAQEAFSLIGLSYLVVIFSSVYLVMYYLEHQRAVKGFQKDISRSELLSVCAICTAVFCISNLSYVTPNTPFSGTLLRDFFNTRTLVNLGGVAILFAYDLKRREFYMQRDLDAIHHILQSQYVQYKQARDSIEVINHKYHDLKHHIALLKADTSKEVSDAYLETIEKDIAQYEVQNKTGNPVLDTVLTSKNIYCQRHHIELTSVADGTLLQFIEPVDICTLFGNSLDNAIEAALQIPDKEKRLVHVSVFSRKQFLIIKVANYFEHKLKFEQGMPMTTKKRQDYHGYGIKSMQYVAKQYGGVLSLKHEKDWFELKIMIPMQKADL